MHPFKDPQAFAKREQLAKDFLCAMIVAGAKTFEVGTEKPVTSFVACWILADRFLEEAKMRSDFPPQNAE